MTTQFMLANAGKFALGSVQYSCVFHKLKLNNAEGNSPYEAEGIRSKPKDSVITEMVAMEQIAAECWLPFAGRGYDLKVEYADLSIMASYNVNWLPFWKGVASFRFRTKPTTGGKVAFVPVPSF
ncbi:MAG: hypothetical protein JNK87_33880 [Bryobacterales bacterium]|nr:hypothetical protein [Bryobacterales bacterium]